MKEVKKVNQKNVIMKNSKMVKENINEKKLYKEYLEMRDELLYMIKELNNHINPYTMEYIRTSLPLIDTLSMIGEQINSLAEIGRRVYVYMYREETIYSSDVNWKGRDCNILDIRGLHLKIGAENYGRIFKFLEKMDDRFKDYPNLRFLHRLKYRSYNSMDRPES